MLGMQLSMKAALPGTSGDQTMASLRLHPSMGITLLLHTGVMAIMVHLRMVLHHMARLSMSM
jgi:hypothetical protein